MALSATIYKATVELSDLNRHFYHQFQLTIAKHPSENDARFMYRLVAFLFAAHEDLKFTKGLSTTEEPEIWQQDATGEIIQWIEMGLPEPKRLKQACGKSKWVKVFTYDKGNLVEKSMNLSCLIEENILYLGNDSERIGVSIDSN